jgi:hypothetical protein
MIEALFSKLAETPHDKALHFIGGVLLFSLSLPLVGPAYALALVAVIGILKEVYDFAYKETHTPDVWDVLVTIFGGVVGFSCTLWN